MNIHVKIWDCNQQDDKMEEIVALIRKYDCEKHIYFMTTNDNMIRKVMEYAPDLKCCVGWDGNNDPLSMVNRAIELGAYKMSLKHSSLRSSRRYLRVRISQGSTKIDLWICATRIPTIRM